MANELATANKPKAPITIKDYMSAPAVRNKMQEMLQSPELIRQFTTSVISIAGSDELLAVAEPRSLFNACLMAASLNLPINKNLGQAHIIGYRNNKKGVVEAQFQLGARGYRELAIRSGQYTVINQGDVREGELAGRNRLTGEINFNWNDNDVEREKLPVVGYFSYFRLSNGFSSTLYMSKEEVTNHGKQYSQSYKRGYGPWVDNFNAMALKTVSKLNISKNGPLSIDMQKAIAVDQAVIHDEDKLEYVDGMEVIDVGADDEKKAAIIAANQEENNTAESDNAPVTDEDLDNLEASGGQATLIDEPTNKSSSYGDNPNKRPARK
jgi:recombination protein RecT